MRTIYIYHGHNFFVFIFVFALEIFVFLFFLSICFSLCSRFCLFAFHFNGCSWTINSAIITFCASANRFYSHFLRLHYSLAHHRYRYTYLPSFFLSLSHFCIIINIVSLRDIVTAIYSFFSNEMKNKKKTAENNEQYLSPSNQKLHFLDECRLCLCRLFYFDFASSYLCAFKTKIVIQIDQFPLPKWLSGSVFYLYSFDWLENISECFFDDVSVCECEWIANSIEM